MRRPRNTFNSSGTIGWRIVREALRRGHMVTAIVCDPVGVDLAHERLIVTRGDVRDPHSVVRVIAGHVVVVSAIGPRGDEQAQMVVDAAHALVQGLQRAGDWTAISTVTLICTSSIRFIEPG